MTTAGALFLVWGPPSHGPRSRVFAAELGIGIEFVEASHRRGILIAPYKYAVQAAKTIALLWRLRPGLVFVQSPPSFATWIVCGYSRLTGADFVVDAHSDAMLSSWWTRPRWLVTMVARRARATIVTNNHFAEALRRLGAHSVVLPDIPAVFPTNGESPRVASQFSVLVVNTFAADEPLAEVLQAAVNFPDVPFFVTGRGRTVPEAPPNVRFTGFLPAPVYYDLMRSVGVVMCLTKRDHTMQRGACEALSIGKPIITSHWSLLRDYFHLGTVHVDNTTGGITTGITEIRRDLPRYQAEILDLQQEQAMAWTTARTSLLANVPHLLNV